MGGVDSQRHEFWSFAVTHKPGQLRTVFALLPYVTRRKCQCLCFGHASLVPGTLVPDLYLKDLHRSLEWKQASYGKSMKSDMWASLERRHMGGLERVFAGFGTIPRALLFRKKQRAQRFNMQETKTQGDATWPWRFSSQVAAFCRLWQPPCVVFLPPSLSSSVSCWNASL